MNGLFQGCNSLKELPDLSKWNTNKIKIKIDFLVKLIK